MDIWTLHDELSLAKPSFKWLSPDYIKLGLNKIWMEKAYLAINHAFF